MYENHRIKISLRGVELFHALQDKKSELPLRRFIESAYLGDGASIVEA